MNIQTEELKPWRKWMTEHRFFLLLCTLVILIFGSPIAKSLHPPRLFARLLILSFLSFMLLGALFAVSRCRRQRIVASLLSVPAILLQAIHVFHEDPHIRGWAYGLTIVYVGYVIALIIKALFQQRRITGDMICASLCAYLLIGVCWAFVYSLVEMFQPGSFNISDAHKDVTTALNVTGEHAGFAVYYSFVTLSTLGYGDVIPVKAMARVCSYSEAVFGQIYLAVLVARLVGLHISQTLTREKSEK
jgi:hypothetical protein